MGLDQNPEQIWGVNHVNQLPYLPGLSIMTQIFYLLPHESGRATIEISCLRMVLDDLSLWCAGAGQSEYNIVAVLDIAACPPMIYPKQQNSYNCLYFLWMNNILGSPVAGRISTQVGDSQNSSCHLKQVWQAPSGISSGAYLSHIDYQHQIAVTID